MKCYRCEIELDTIQAWNHEWGFYYECEECQLCKLRYCDPRQMNEKIAKMKRARNMEDKPRAIIVDIDGTLSDSSHRKHFLEGDKKDWNSFYACMADDSPNIEVRSLVWTYIDRRDYHIIFLTGRPEKYKKITEDWLLKCIVDGYGHETLMMRPDGDFTPDHELKLKIYEEQIKPHYNVRLVLEDRTRNVVMWRSLGLQCWQVAEGDF
jgi:hypothetical protein